MRIVLFGAGNSGKKLYMEIVSQENQNDYVVCFADNDALKWGDIIGNAKVVPPDTLNEYDYDVIIPCGMYSNDIKSQLMQNGFSEHIILSELEYRRYAYAKFQYYKRNYNFNRKMISKKIVVYTAITGNYDDLIEPEVTNSLIDYVCFTNDIHLRSKKWNIEILKDSSIDDIRLARKVKLFPECFFDRYDISIWVDAKYHIKDNLLEYASDYLRESGMVIFPHPERNCIYDEAAECIHLNKGVKKDIIRQISAYYAEGYPFENGLYESGCIVREHNNDFIKMIMSKWWEQICVFSYRDQLSFPYICWKNGFLPDICDMDINDNKYLKTIRHHV